MGGEAGVDGQPAPVDGDALARDEAGFVGGEKERERGDILGFAGAGVPASRSAIARLRFALIESYSTAWRRSIRPAGGAEQEPLRAFL